MKSSVILVVLFLQYFSSIATDKTNPFADQNIPIKSQESDYYISHFNEPNIYYLDKFSAAIGINDICEVHSPKPNLLKISAEKVEAEDFFVLNNKICFYKSGKIKVTQLEESYGRLRYQPLSILDLHSIIGNYNSSQSPEIRINSMNGNMFLTLEDQLYIMNTNTIFIKLLIKSRITTGVSFQNGNFAFINPNRLFFFNKNTHVVEVYLIQEDGNLVRAEEYDNIQNMLTDSKNLYLISRQKINIITQEQASEIKAPKSITLAENPKNDILYIYTEEISENVAEIYSLDINEHDTEFRLMLTCPKGAQRLFFGKNNLMLSYSNWLRIYPSISSAIFSKDFYQDFALNDDIHDIWMLDSKDILIVQTGYLAFNYYKLNLLPGFLECKKQAQESIESYPLQLRILVSSCEFIEGKVERHSNGSCSISQTFHITPIHRNTLLYQIMSLLGGICLGGVLVKLYEKYIKTGIMRYDKEEVENAKLKKEKKIFNINKGLSRFNSLNNNTSTIETKKFITDYDEVVPSEELRDVVPIQIDNYPKPVKPQHAGNTFETPRFSFALLNSSHNIASLPSNDSVKENSQEETLRPENKEDEKDENPTFRKIE